MRRLDDKTDLGPTTACGAGGEEFREIFLKKSVIYRRNIGKKMQLEPIK